MISFHRCVCVYVLCVCVYKIYAIRGERENSLIRFNFLLYVSTGTQMCGPPSTVGEKEKKKKKGKFYFYLNMYTIHEFDYFW